VPTLKKFATPAFFTSQTCWRRRSFDRESTRIRPRRPHKRSGAWVIRSPIPPLLPKPN